MARLQTAKKATHAPSQPKQKSQSQPTDVKEKNKSPKKQPQPQESGKAKGKAPAKSGKDTDSFKEAVLALGGDVEDYDLLKNVDSDAETPTAGSSKNDVSTPTYLIFRVIIGMRLCRLRSPKIWLNS